MIYLIQNDREYDYDVRAIALAFYERTKIVEVTKEEFEEQEWEKDDLLLTLVYTKKRIQGWLKGKVGIEGNTINGVFDPTATKKTAEGLIELIRIAQDNKGLQALPEEFSHLVDAVLKGTNNPIYDRLTNLLKNEDIIKSIFEQEEIGSYDRYSSLYKGNIDRLADEARAKLLAKHIIRNEEIKASP